MMNIPPNFYTKSSTKIELGKRKVLHRLRHLCCSGHPLIMIMPDVCKLIRQLIPNANTGLGLVHPNGMLYAFYNESTDTKLLALMMNHPELFMDFKTEPHLTWFTTTSMPKCGNALHSTPEYFRSNTYQYLIRPSSCDASLEVRLEVNQIPAGGLVLHREPKSHFHKTDIPLLLHVARYMEFALSGEQDNLFTLESCIGTEQALIIVTPQYDIMWMTEIAAQLLQQIPLSCQFWQPNAALPICCLNVIYQLQYGEDLPQMQIIIPNGILQIRAEWLKNASENHRMIALHLKKVLPKSLLYWQKIQNSDLSPQEAHVAYLLVTGLSKPVVRAQLGLSEAVMKDCMKSIYQYFNVHSLLELIDCIKNPISCI